MGQLKKKTKSTDTPSKKRKLEKPAADSPSKPDKSAKVLAEQSFEEFLQGWDNSDGGSGDDEAPNAIEKTAETKTKKKKIVKKKTKKSDDSEVEKKEGKTKEGTKKKGKKSAEKGESSDEDDVEMDIEKQKQFMGSLKDKDPAFYEFLQKEEKGLLEFGNSSGEEDENGEGKIHILPDKLEDSEDSEQEDFEPEDDLLDEEPEVKGKVTNKMVKDWIANLKKPATPKEGVQTIKDVVAAFKAAIISFNDDPELREEWKDMKYVCQGAGMFNAILRMCVMYIYPTLKKVLGITEDDGWKIKHTKKATKLGNTLRQYLRGLVILIARLHEPESGTIIIKHTMQMLHFLQTYPKGQNLMMKSLVKCWSQGHDSIRVAALLCLVKMGRIVPSCKEPVLKKMFDAYVSNSKFTSPSNMATINFMRRSLVEMYGLDHKLAYYQAFVQIRQLAIHLRTALQETNLENVQAVYNWQFVHSIELWGAVLSSAADSELLRPLIYPFVQVTLGTIKLVESPKFFPLKFHCAKVLTQVSVHTRTFIPILPIYIHILNNYNFGKKKKKIKFAFKPMDFTCVLKVNKSNQLLSGFKDAVIEEAYAGILTYLAMNSHKIGFPELVTPMVFQLRKFFKKCTSPFHSKPIKQCVEKALANSKLIEQKRRSVTFGVGDAKEIQIWEAKVERDGTPIKAFYESWKRASDKRRMVRISKDFKGGIDYADIPIIDKAKVEKKKKKEMAAEEAKKKDGEEEKGFLSGEESDEVPDEERFRPKDEMELKKKAKMEKKKMAKAYSDDSDDDDNDDDDDDGSDMDDGDDKDGSESEEEKEESEDKGDKVQDLNLDDLDQFDEEDEAMKDDFGVGDDDDDDDSSPNDDDDDDDDSD